MGTSKITCTNKSYKKSAKLFQSMSEEHVLEVRPKFNGK